jgi:serine/threonine-protein kinase RsbW
VRFVPTPMANLPNVALSIASRPQNVSLVRELLTGVAESTGLERSALDDIRTAVTEACNNVVLHAYDGREGPLEVELYARAPMLEIVVRDRGSGLSPGSASPSGPAVGLGIAMIQALTERVEFKDAPGAGAEVLMRFAAPDAHELGELPADGFELPSIPEPELANQMAVTFAPPTLAAAVLPRMLSAVAAHARFSIERVGAVQRLADTLAAELSTSANAGYLHVMLSAEIRDLELRIEPLRTMEAAPQAAANGDGHDGGPWAAIGQLADEHHVQWVGSSEQLTLRLVDRTR